MTKKQLLERIRSLEEYLGVAYSPKDSKDSYAEHVTKGYGKMAQLKQTRGMVDKLVKATKVEEELDIYED